MGCTCCKCKSEEEQNRSMDVLMGNLLNPFKSVTKRVSSLKEHNVTMEEVESLRDEIRNRPKFFGGIAVITLFSLFVSGISALVVSINRDLLTAIQIKTSKMTQAKALDYLNTTGQRILNSIGNRYQMGGGVLEKIVWVIFACVCLFVLMVNVMIWRDRKLLSALAEYERFLLRKKDNETGGEM